MKTLTIKVEDTKFEALRDFLDSQKIDFYDNSGLDFEISETHKKHIRELVDTSKDTDFISWKEFKSGITK